MKALKTNFTVKVIAFLLALATGVGGFWASLFTLYQWDTLWLNSGYYDSVDYYADLENRSHQVQEMARLLQFKEWDGGLPYLDQRRLDTLEEALSPENTNFRYTIRRNEGGTLIASNLEGAATLDSTVHTVEQSELLVGGSEPHEQGDYVVWNSEDRYYLLYVMLPDGTKRLFVPEDSDEAVQYGYIFDGVEWPYNDELDSRATRSLLALEYGVTDPFTVQDEFWEGYQDYSQYVSYLPALAVLALVLDVIGALLVIFLCRAAGWRKGVDGPVRLWFDRIPLDLLAFVEFWVVALLLNAGDVMAFGLNISSMAPDLVVGLGVITAGVLACLLAFCMTVSTRIKTHTLWGCTLIAVLFRLIVRAIRAASRSWPLTWRVVLVFLLYLAGSVLTLFTVILFPIYQGAVLYGLCRWTIQWRKVREDTGKILGGEQDYQINTAHMYHDLAGHARQLNDLGQAIGSAVEERIQSERFKAELITNVSHDLKTPLTSIINYVDLLKKKGLDSPDAPAYLEVLDRKSQRLKKLTEDLVEASKASTGSLPVHLERLGMVQLFQQALGEFEEKFQQNRLTVVPQLPPDELWIMADGRHLWRVIDNLLGNCNKYAQEGTRIYADIFRQEGRVALSIKNVSRQQLNIPAQQLMERFVRGDESRTTEGSGLGLSIARSLTELQSGQFDIDIDGDLFKVLVSFPEAPDLPAPALPN